MKLGYVASIGTLTFDQLSQSKIPVLVGMKIGKFYHFAIYRGTDGYWVYLADPARGNFRGPVKEFVDSGRRMRSSSSPRKIRTSRRTLR